MNRQAQSAVGVPKSWQPRIPFRRGPRFRQSRAVRLAHLRLRDFRNYARLDTDFSPGFHVLLGGNAQSKTNILEAITDRNLLSGRSAVQGALVFHRIHLLMVLRLLRRRSEPLLGVCRTDPTPHGFSTGRTCRAGFPGNTGSAGATSGHTPSAGRRRHFLCGRPGAVSRSGRSRNQASDPRRRTARRSTSRGRAASGALSLKTSSNLFCKICVLLAAR